MTLSRILKLLIALLVVVFNISLASAAFTVYSGAVYNAEQLTVDGQQYTFFISPSLTTLQVRGPSETRTISLSSCRDFDDYSFCFASANQSPLLSAQINISELRADASFNFSKSTITGYVGDYDDMWVTVTNNGTATDTFEISFPYIAGVRMNPTLPCILENDRVIFTTLLQIGDSSRCRVRMHYLDVIEASTSLTTDVSRHTITSEAFSLSIDHPFDVSLLVNDSSIVLSGDPEETTLIWNITNNFDSTLSGTLSVSILPNIVSKIYSFSYDDGLHVKDFTIDKNTTYDYKLEIETNDTTVASIESVLSYTLDSGELITYTLPTETVVFNYTQSSSSRCKESSEVDPSSFISVKLNSSNGTSLGVLQGSAISVYLNNSVNDIDLTDLVFSITVDDTLYDFGRVDYLPSCEVVRLPDIILPGYFSSNKSTSSISVSANATNSISLSRVSAETSLELTHLTPPDVSSSGTLVGTVAPGSIVRRTVDVSVGSGDWDIYPLVYVEDAPSQNADVRGVTQRSLSFLGTEDNILDYTIHLPSNFTETSLNFTTTVRFVSEDGALVYNKTEGYARKKTLAAISTTVTLPELVVLGSLQTITLDITNDDTRTLSDVSLYLTPNSSIDVSKRKFSLDTLYPGDTTQVTFRARFPDESNGSWQPGIVSYGVEDYRESQVVEAVTVDYTYSTSSTSSERILGFSFASSAQYVEEDKAYFFLWNVTNNEPTEQELFLPLVDAFSVSDDASSVILAANETYSFSYMATDFSVYDWDALYYYYADQKLFTGFVLPVPNVTHSQLTNSSNDSFTFSLSSSSVSSSQKNTPSVQEETVPSDAAINDNSNQNTPSAELVVGTTSSDGNSRTVPAALGISLLVIVLAVVVIVLRRFKLHKQ